MRRSEEDLKKLVELVREANTAGWVCDSLQGCEKWERLWGSWKNICLTFTFCPWCGKKLDWQTWERLK